MLNIKYYIILVSMRRVCPSGEAKGVKILFNRHHKVVIVGFYALRDVSPRCRSNALVFSSCITYVNRTR